MLRRWARDTWTGLRALADPSPLPADAVAAELREGCLSMPEPAPSDVFKHVYSTPNSWLDRQQDHYERYLASFAQEPQEGPR